MTERATLIGFDEPSDLAGTSWTPAASRMARPGAVAEGGDAAVVAETAAVEDHAGDAGAPGPLADELAHRLGGVDRGRGAVPQPGLGGGGGGYGAPGRVVDELGVDVPVGPEY